MLSARRTVGTPMISPASAAANSQLSCMIASGFQSSITRSRLGSAARASVPANSSPTTTPLASMRLAPAVRANTASRTSSGAAASDR